MYVCICNGLTSNKINDAIDTGVKKSNKIHSYFDCKPKCGKCLDFIDEIISTKKHCSNANNNDKKNRVSSSL